jgi:hypothetical protein
MLKDSLKVIAVDSIGELVPLRPGVIDSYVAQQTGIGKRLPNAKSNYLCRAPPFFTPSIR